MTSAILIHDTTIITADADGTIHHGISIAVEGGQIAAIGSDSMAEDMVDEPRLGAPFRNPSRT